MSEIASTRIGPGVLPALSALDVWLVNDAGCIEGPPLEPSLAEQVVALAERAATIGQPQTGDAVDTSAAGESPLRLVARPFVGGKVAVAMTRLAGLKELEETLGRCDLVFRATHDAVWEWNVVTQEAWWNAHQYEMLGYDPKLTKPAYAAWLARIHPDDRERVQRHFEEAVASTKLTWQDEFRFLRGDGRVGVALDRGYIERDASGKPQRVVGVMTDITEQKAATDALQASEERFRQLASAIDEAFWMIDGAGNEVIYVSPAYETIWGRSCQSLYDDPRSFIAAIDEEDRARVTAALAFHHGGTFDEVYRIRRPDGTRVWIRDRAFPVYDAEGKVVRIAGVATDITKQRQLEEQLVQAGKLESIGRLAGGVAHDFNNLLTVILSSAQLAMRALPDGAPVLADLEHIRDAGERAAWLTAQLLTFARRQVVAPKLLDVNDLVKRVDHLLRRLIGEHIELRTVLGAGLHGVLADPGQVEQVLVNLAANARDAMPDGGRLTLETSNLAVSAADAASQLNLAPGDFVMLSVSDTGVGIPPEALEHIFEPFFTTKAPGRGTGLGLATCYGIVQQAGGQIAVESAAGRGTKFKIMLPRAPGEAVFERTTPSEKPPRGVGTVLFVEDDPVVRGVGMRILSGHGYHVLGAANGDAALRIAVDHQGPIDLLLTDVIMPNMNGAELASRLSRIRVGIIVLYTSGHAEDALAGVLQPDDGFLPKPYTADSLLAKVREVFKASAAADELRGPVAAHGP